MVKKSKNRGVTARKKSSAELQAYLNMVSRNARHEDKRAASNKRACRDFRAIRED